jgi:predicted DNA binding CopG/RHH family protein
VELQSNDVDLARELAARHGVEYQTYVQNLVHDALILAKAS